MQILINRINKIVTRKKINLKPGKFKLKCLTFLLVSEKEIHCVLQSRNWERQEP